MMPVCDAADAGPDLLSGDGDAGTLWLAALPAGPDTGQRSSQMRKLHWQVKLGLVLVALSAIVYLAHFLVFHDLHHIFIYLVGDIAFVPMEVLLVTLIIHRLLEVREKRSMLRKLNMVIGAFFSEAGSPLMKLFDRFDPAADEAAQRLIVENQWGNADFAAARAYIVGREFKIDARRGDLVALRDFLADRRGFLLRLLENPNLLEHQAFTDLLWAVFHLTEELVARHDLGASPETDLEHLAGDIRRAYQRLLLQWLAYMRHLRDDYPYLFSLASRTNPFNPAAAPEVTA